MANTSEDPNDPGSFAYLLKLIIGTGRGVQARAAEHLNISPAYLSVILNGYQVPNKEAAKAWLEKLRKHYDLERLFGDTGLTLEKAYERKIPFLKQPKKQPVLRTPRIKPASKEEIKLLEADFKREAGKLLRALREVNGHTIKDLAAHMRTSSVLRNGPEILEKIESKQDAVVKTVRSLTCRIVITEICGFYEKFSPEKSAPYIAQLIPICEQLRPR